MSGGDSGIKKNKAKKAESDVLERVVNKGWRALWDKQETSIDSSYSPQGAQSLGRKDYQPLTPENNNKSIELCGTGHR